MWEIAQDQGIKLPTKHYWEFEKLITITGITSFKNYLSLFHWTELIQSSPEALERCVYSIASGAYRKNNITTLELRFNPMKRNRGGERDLDHIILSAVHSMQRAMLAYPIRLGFIFCLDRTFSPSLNAIIAQKAIKYAKLGVVGIDLAGPHHKDFDLKSLIEPVAACKKAGLGVTIHSGEVTDADEVMQVIEYLQPNRIGHGIKAVKKPEVLQELARQKIVLEICPTSNLLSSIVRRIEDFRHIFSELKKYQVPFTINTDNPEILQTNLVNEYNLLFNNRILTNEELLQASETARQASFIHGSFV